MIRQQNLLIFADSDHDANMLYAVGTFVPDPFIYAKLRGREYVVLSDLEIDRVRKQAPHCRALSLSRYQQRLRRAGVRPPGVAQVIQTVLREKKIRQVFVPENFPLRLAEELRKLGVRVRPKQGNFFAEREQKSANEVRKIRDALEIAEIGMAAGMRVLRASKISKHRQLIYRHSPLTSERLRSVIDTAVLQAGGLPANTIVAGGKQACDPHERGHGVLRPHELIIIDIFPRSQTTGYFGDITRTVVRGRAGESARKLYDTVFRGQQIAFRKIRAGVPTADVHRDVFDFFNAEGFKTGRVNGRMEGFFHGTGHGLGLEIHEAPRMGSASTGNLKAGHIVTVEPGLYYSNIGGVRLEDVALVARTGAQSLTRFKKVLEI